jgi:voltage-gated potassium channel
LATALGARLDAGAAAAPRSISPHLAAPRRHLPMLRSPALRRFLIALVVLTCVWFGGALGYHQLGHGRWGYGECAYHTVVTVFTVGYAELPGADKVHGARFFTAFLIVVGVGAMGYVQASLTSIFVEGALGVAYRQSRMRKSIDRMRDHVVVAGCGSTGRHAIEELRASGRDVVAIDRDESRLRELQDENAPGGEFHYVVGDATHDHALVAAGVAHAWGVVAALTDDADNLYVTLSARALNVEARIVAKAVAPEAEGKMRRAGANAVVSPNSIGGMRMASELVRPEVVEFLDQLHRTEKSLRIEEILIPKDSSWVGKMLRDAPIRPRTRALVIAKRTRDGAFHYNPGPESTIEAGMTLVVLGDREDVSTLHELVAATRGER